MRTLRETAARAGRVVEFDRAQVIRGDGRGQVVTLTGERIDLIGAESIAGTSVSLRGIFADARTLSVDAVRVHDGWRRDLPTYVGLALVAVLWLPRRLRDDS